MQKKFDKQRGFASAVILLLAATLALIAYKVIDIGIIGINIANEKQVLDMCSLHVGNNIIKTNDIENACSPEFLNSCRSIIEGVNGLFECVDNGLECDLEGVCKRSITVTSTYNPGIRDVSKSVTVRVNEEIHDINLVDAAVIMLLDFSGSMSGNRMAQLKSTALEFINSNFNLSYSVILYNEDVIITSNIGKGQNHNQSVMSIINNNQAGGGTNYTKPLQAALNQIENTNYEAYYILLISDGAPNEGAEPSINLINSSIINNDPNSCLYMTYQNPCISVYTLGVDNADTNTLGSISGNALSQDPSDYMYTVSANQTSAAFNAIIEEIMCRIGPVLAGEGLNIFNELEVLELNVDYIFDDQNKVLKFYDEEPFNICTEMLNNNSNITIRWGNPSITVHQ